ncbi:MAG TPA: 2-oxoacid:ferredoxin oxidoreductase subunit beta [Patescibacteria group bacterium]|jgi:2-oxoglutarate ferredoxin oxidoreductase subunit beta|nr:2-oxoacid:ferredoxin oxidoreductase subunit beta [Patescibacteria group bacterium]
MTAKEFQSDQEVRWCPGCGDYAILSAVTNVFPKLGIPRENFVVVSGIGCSSRFPYYTNTYGFHTIHGRAPAIATGLKTMRRDLSVWVVTGDGDGMSIGGNHLIHAMRRNVELKILLFNNRIYGLTKGQASPTSEIGKRTASSPYGTYERPFNTVSLVLGAEATFVARSVDIYRNHLQEMLTRAAEHRGTAFIEIFQNCNIFNDGAFSDVVEPTVRDDRNLLLRHGQPLAFGKTNPKGIRRNPDNGMLEVVELGNGITEKDLVVHDERRPDPDLAFELSRLDYPLFPTPIGVFRSVQAPTSEDLVWAQVDKAKATKPKADLGSLLRRGDVWQVTDEGQVLQIGSE